MTPQRLKIHPGSDAENGVAARGRSDPRSVARPAGLGGAARLDRRGVLGVVIGSAYGLAGTAALLGQAGADVLDLPVPQIVAVVAVALRQASSRRYSPHGGPPVRPRLRRSRNEAAGICDAAPDPHHCAVVGVMGTATTPATPNS